MLWKCWSLQYAGCLSHRNSVKIPCFPWVLVAQWLERPPGVPTGGHGFDSCWGLGFFSLSHARVMLINSPFSSVHKVVKIFSSYPFRRTSVHQPCDRTCFSHPFPWCVLDVQGQARNVWKHYPKYGTSIHVYSYWRLSCKSLKLSDNWHKPRQQNPG